MTRREIRQRAKWSLARAACVAGVSEPTARLYEANPESVKSTHKRAALDRIYDHVLRPLADATEQPAPTREAV